MDTRSFPQDPVARRGPAWSALAAVLLASLSLVAAPARADDDPPGRIGRVAETQGQVWMLDQDKREWFDLQRNRPFTTGDRIATDREARVELQIGSTTVRLDGRSELNVVRLDDDRIDLTLVSGSAAVRLREPEVIREFTLQSGELGFQPRSTGLFRVDHTDRGAHASVLSGDLQVAGREVRLDLRAGQHAELWVDPVDRRLQSAWAPLADDDFERYVRYEDAREEPRTDRVAVRGTVSPEMTGGRELERNGRWEQHPEYGTIWSPTTVAVGWAPYRFGHWIWMARWGWTWVDDAPWGFAPFHYGRWVNWGGRWCWAPGGYVRRPVYAPAMVGWVGGSHVSMSVSVGGPPMVGWIPLAPREVYYPAYRHSPVYVQNINITHVHQSPERWRQPPPAEPTMYTNRGVPGGVTMVSSQVLTNREPVGRAVRPSDDLVTRALDDRRATIIAPPARNGQLSAPSPNMVTTGPSQRPAQPTPRGVTADRSFQGSMFEGDAGEARGAGGALPRGAPGVAPAAVQPTAPSPAQPVAQPPGRVRPAPVPRGPAQVAEQPIRQPSQPDRDEPFERPARVERVAPAPRVDSGRVELPARSEAPVRGPVREPQGAKERRTDPRRGND